MNVTFVHSCINDEISSFEFADPRSQKLLRIPRSLTGVLIQSDPIVAVFPGLTPTKNQAKRKYLTTNKIVVQQAPFIVKEEKMLFRDKFL